MHKVTTTVVEVWCSFQNQTYKILSVLQGYQGMVDGSDNIVEVSWESVSSILQVVSAKEWEWDPKPRYSNKRTKILDPGNCYHCAFDLCDDWVTSMCHFNRAWFLQCGWLTLAKGLGLVLNLEPRNSLENLCSRFATSHVIRLLKPYWQVYI